MTITLLIIYCANYHIRAKRVASRWQASEPTCKHPVDAHALNGLGGPCCVANLIPLQKKEQVLEILEVVVEQEPGSELISSKFEAMK